MRSNHRPRTTSRRDVLRSMLLGGLALGLPRCADDAAKGSGRPRIAIVGGGMGGVATAWLLDGAWDVTLYEARPVLGGQVRTIAAGAAGSGDAAVEVDVGAQYYAPGLYPTYTRLLASLALDAEAFEFDATITVLEAGLSDPRFVSPAPPDRTWPLSASWNADGIAAFATMALESPKLESDDVGYDLTVGAWLASIDLSETQREAIALPWITGLSSGDVEQVRQCSARALMRYLSATVGDDPFAVPRYRTQRRGMIAAIQALAGQCTTLEVRLDGAVTALARSGDGFRVRTAAGSDRFDALVLALPAEKALPLLVDVAGSERQRAALAGIQFHDTRIAIHSQPTFAATDPQSWSFVNMLHDGAYAEASMQLGTAIQGATLWKSWASHRSVEPGGIVHEEAFRHPLASPASVAAQAALRALAGEDGLWFVGGWMHPYDLQETAILSALDVADALNPGSARAASLSETA
ncbi:MAG: FAD-dependent oxidoreductase [Myxococcota bacterium]